MRESEATSPQTGTVPYDTTMILTRHRSLPLGEPCAKVAALRETPGTPLQQLQAAHEALCTCGSGEAEWERTIYRDHS